MVGAQEGKGLLKRLWCFSEIRKIERPLLAILLYSAAVALPWPLRFQQRSEIASLRRSHKWPPFPHAASSQPSLWVETLLRGDGGREEEVEERERRWREKGETEVE